MLAFYAGCAPSCKDDVPLSKQKSQDEISYEEDLRDVQNHFETYINDFHTEEGKNAIRKVADEKRIYRSSYNPNLESRNTNEPTTQEKPQENADPVASLTQAIAKCKTTAWDCYDVSHYALLVDKETSHSLLLSALDILSRRDEYEQMFTVAHSQGLDKKAEQAYSLLTSSCRNEEFSDFLPTISTCISAAHTLHKSKDEEKFETMKKKYRLRVEEEIRRGNAQSNPAEMKKHYKRALHLITSSTGKGMLTYYDGEHEEIYKQLEELEKKLPLFSVIDTLISSPDIVTQWRGFALVENTNDSTVKENGSFFERVAQRLKKKKEFSGSITLEKKLGHREHALATAILGAQTQVSNGNYSLTDLYGQGFYVVAAGLLAENDPRKKDFLRRHLLAHIGEQYYSPEDIRLAADLGDTHLAGQIVTDYIASCKADPSFCSGNKYGISTAVRNYTDERLQAQFFIGIGSCQDAVPLAISLDDQSLLDNVAKECTLLLERTGSSSDLSLLSSLEAKSGNSERAETYALFARVFSDH